MAGSGERASAGSYRQDEPVDGPVVIPDPVTVTEQAPRHYPENQMVFAPDYGQQIPGSWQRFFDLREELLLGYGYQTARAYWADLQSWFEWAIERDKDVLALSKNDQAQYRALLRRRKYSESTIRRRGTALRLLYEADGASADACAISPRQHRTE